jgi:hypothetical protein
MRWRELAATSHYQTAIAVKQALQEGEICVGRGALLDGVERPAPFCLFARGDTITVAWEGRIGV